MHTACDWREDTHQLRVNCKVLQQLSKVRVSSGSFNSEVSHYEVLTKELLSFTHRMRFAFHA